MVKIPWFQWFYWLLIWQNNFSLSVDRDHVVYTELISGNNNPHDSKEPRQWTRKTSTNTATTKFQQGNRVSNEGIFQWGSITHINLVPVTTFGQSHIYQKQAYHGDNITSIRTSVTTSETLSHPQETPSYWSQGTSNRDIAVTTSETLSHHQRQRPNHWSLVTVIRATSQPVIH